MIRQQKPLEVASAIATTVALSYFSHKEPAKDAAATPGSDDDATKRCGSNVIV
jgi:hypothetical protein